MYTIECCYTCRKVHNGSLTTCIQFDQTESYIKQNRNLKLLASHICSALGPALRRRNSNRGFTLKTHQMFSFHTTPEEFENGIFTLKTHQMFSVYSTPEKFKIETITGHFGFDNRDYTVFEKLPFQNALRPHKKRNAGVFKNPRV